MNRTLRLGVGILTGLVLLGGSFYGGMVVGKNQARASGNTQLLVPSQSGEGMPGGMPAPGQDGGTQGRGMGAGQGAPGGGGQGGMLVGEITEIGDGTLTIKDSSGASTTVKVSDTTLIEKQASVTLADLTAGETVVVSGSKADDGTITARSLQIAPAGRVGGAAPAGGTDGAAPGGDNQGGGTNP